MQKGHVFQDDDRVFGRVVLEQGLEVRGASGEDHLVCLARLAVTGQGDVGERLLVAQVLERRHHVRLEVIPAEAKLLILSHLG